MHGDISRSTFDPARRRSAVRQQQGRGVLDADWNEQRDIELHEARTTNTDVIGAAAGPLGGAGFEVSATPTGDGLEIGVGRYYVDGIRCEQDSVAAITPLPTAAGRYLAYLDVWERPVTAVDDPDIREVALGGPDTTTRTEVVARARLLAVDAPGPAPDCTTAFPEWDVLVAGATGEVEVRVDAAAVSTDPCLVPEDAGYRGLENQLYRIQIHDGNLEPTAAGGIGPATPSFKWARDNASAVGSWGAPSDLDIQVDRLGPGGAEGFRLGGWVELTTDTGELDTEPGILAAVDDVVGVTLTLAGDASLAGEVAAAYDADLHPKIRRWDSAGALDLDAGGWVDLEQGVQVRFATGRSWRSGDFWIVPARTAVLPGTGDRQIEWPVDGAGSPGAVAPHGPAHHVAKLAVVKLSGTTWTVLGDCREEFAPLADLVSFTSAGGDGQHAPSGHWLPKPLAVTVARGRHAVEGRTVRFRIDGAAGALSVAEPDENGVAVSTGAEVTMATDADGRAALWWRLGAGPLPEEPGDNYQRVAAQTVVAELLDAGGAVDHLPIEFHATPLDQLVLVAAGGDAQIGYPGETLEIALRARVTAGSRPAAGQHVAFEIESRMLDGSALDEFRGGSLHATTNVVSVEPWPAGSRTVRAVVGTGTDGVAQVQWVLGTETGLPVQRVVAGLVGTGVTAQVTLFSAHLAIAEEVLWDPCAALTKLVDQTRPRHTVQEALDLFCDLFVGGTEGKVVLSKKGGTAPLAVSSVVPVGDLAGVDVELARPVNVPMIPVVLQSVLDVHTVEPSGQVDRPTLLRGAVTVASAGDGSSIRWRIAAPSRKWLEGHVASVGQVVVHVTLRPALLGPGNLLTTWCGAFRVGP